MTAATGGLKQATSVFVVLNPNSGGCDSGLVRAALGRHFSEVGVACQVHEPSHDDSLTDLVRAAVEAGADLVVAAGGDGTVSGVADALTGTETPLGILPLGTANVLAGELGIPFQLEAACALLAGPHAIDKIDTIEIGGKAYVTQVGVGLDALMIRDTTGAHKKRFGRVAYLWTALTRLAGFQPRRFVVTVDGQTRRHRALQVVVANSGTLGQRPFRWGPDIRPDDGRLDVCIVRTRTIVDLARLGWHVVTSQHKSNPNVRYLAATREVTIASNHPLPVQADGEIVGETPVTLRLVPASVRVVVPATVPLPTH